MRGPGVKAQIMAKISRRTGAKWHDGAEGTRYMTTQDFRRILHYIEDLEVQRDEALQKLAETQKQEVTK